MSTGRNVGCLVGSVLGFIVAAVLLFFGVLWMVGSTAPGANPAWFTQGIVMIVIGLVLVGGAVYGLVASRPKPPQEIIQKIDLSGDIEMEKLKCKNCGAELERESVEVRAGAIFVSCPYCGSSYQMVEEPKW